MSSLGVYGDPGGWQQAGDTIRAVAAQLAEELAAADAAGGNGLLAAWSGPVAETYHDLWNHRHARYGDLLYHAGRAATAFIDFGERLADLQGRAADLEWCWRGAGLHLALDGMRFMLPGGHENLPQEAQATLRNALAESERDIGAMWADIRAAAGDLVTVLESVLVALADFDVIELRAVGWFASAIWDDPLHAAHDALDAMTRYGHVGEALQTGAEKLKAMADDAAAAVEKDGSRAVRIAARGADDVAGKAVGAAGDFDHYAEVGGRVLGAIGVGVTVAKTYEDIRKHGLANGVEENLGAWTSLAVGIPVGMAVAAAGAALVVAGAPEILVGVGAFVVGTAVCAGVGQLVQSAADSHKKGTDRVLTGIGHGAEHAAIWAGTETGLLPEPAS